MRQKNKHPNCLELTRDTCLQHVLLHAEDGSIVVFHDSLKAFDRLAYVLPGAMEEWSRRGV
jgi:hypothetical protein